MARFTRWIAGALDSAKSVRSRFRRRGSHSQPRNFAQRLQLLCHQPASYVLLTAAVLFCGLLFWPSGCTPTTREPATISETRLIRVCLLQNQDQISIWATDSPTYFTDSDRTPRTLVLPKRATIGVALTSGGWRVGNVTLGTGTLTLRPSADGTLSIEGKAYRGQYRLVPRAPGRFDVVNDVDIDSYLKGVLASEMFNKWHEEAFKAQAIVARTYALYQKWNNRHVLHSTAPWDVFSDTRDQVYGGIGAETQKSRDAVDQTAGVVVAWAPPGQEPKIFKSYFSSCCGGISQSAYDAFGVAYTPPLGDQNVGSNCNASPRFNWGPVVIRKDELTRRFRKWGANNGRSEQNMPPIRQVIVEKPNRFGRPVRFTVIAGTNPRDEVRYSLSSEELRVATNTDGSEGSTLFSSFVNVISDSDVIRFVDGHGWGHGVGMCQWCAQARAEQGYSCEQIVRFAYPQSQLAHAY